VLSSLALIGSDLRHAIRTLRGARPFTFVAVLSIGLGIGANTAVFTLVDQVLLRPLPVNRADRLVQVSADTETLDGGMGDDTELSYAMYRDLRDRNDVFSGMFCRMPWAMQVGYDGRTEQVSGQLVSGTFFPVLGLQPAMGRLLTADDERSIGGHPVAVLGHAYWTRRFASDPTIVGKTIVVNRQPLEVVGVAPAEFSGLDFADPVDVYVPISMQPQMGPARLKLEGRHFRFVQVFGRLRDGVSIEQAGAALQPLYRAVLQDEARDAAFTSASAETRRAFLEGQLTVDDASQGRSSLRTSVRVPLLILMAIAAGVLLIVCANVANLLIARGAARRREMALRLAVGGSRWQIARLLLVESLVLATAGTAAGLLIASWGADALIGFYESPDAALAVHSGPDLRILFFTCAIAVITALVAGLAPAVRGTRVDLVTTLKGSGGGVNEQARMRKALVVVQVALSFLLLVCAGLFVRSLDNLLAVDPGFRTARTVAFSVELEASGYDAERARGFARTLQQRMSRMPGVSSSAYTFQSLLGGGAWGTEFTVEGFAAKPGEGAWSLANAVSPGFFRAMGMTLVAGREFTDRDDRGLKDEWPYTVAVVNETFAARYFGGSSPLGRHVGFGSNPGTPTPIEIVGLVRDAKYTGIRERPRPQIFFPYLQGNIEGLTAYIQTQGDPQSLLASVRREVQALDPNLALVGVTTLERLVEQSVVNERLVATLSAALSVTATLLSVIGLYGVMAYVVARRTREIGIRMALGAIGPQIAIGVLREAGLLVRLGLAAGGLTAWWLGRYIQEQLYEITPADPVTVVLAAVALSAVAVCATLLPATRAARIAPMEAIREE
jgi:predicted permease